MPRSLIALLVALVGCAIGVAFWPGDAPREWQLAGQEQEEEREVTAADAGEIPTFLKPAFESAEEAQAAEASGSREEVTQLATESTEDGDKTYASITAQVVNADGMPLADAVVGALELPPMGDNDRTPLQPLFLAIQGADQPQDFEVNEQLSAADGKVTLRVEAGVQLLVYARLPRHLIAFQVLESVLEEGEEHDAGKLRLAPGGWLEVSAVDDFGQPIKDAAVILSLVNGRQSSPMELPIQYLPTDQDGRAVFQHLSFAEYKLEVAKHGYQHVRMSPVAITQQGDGSQAVTLRKGEVLRGVVMGPFGTVEPGVRVDFRADSEDYRVEGFTSSLLGPRPDVLTDENGRFAIEGAFAGAQYDLTARPQRGLPGRARDVFAADEIVIQLPETTFVRGRVVLADGGPATDAQVGMQRFTEDERRNRSRAATRRVNPDGTFEHWLYPGPYEWFAVHETGEARSQQPREYRGEVNLGDIEIEMGASAVLTYLLPGGGEVERVELDDLIQLDDNGAPSGLRRSRERLARERGGKVHLNGLPAGNYQIESRVRGWLVPRIELSLAPGDEVERSIVVAKGADLRLTVRREDGSNGDGWYRLERLGDSPAEWSHLSRSHRLRVRNGESSWLRGVVPGEWRIRPDRERRSVVELSLGLGEQEFDVTLPPAGR